MKLSKLDLVTEQGRDYIVWLREAVVDKLLESDAVDRYDIFRSADDRQIWTIDVDTRTGIAYTYCFQQNAHDHYIFMDLLKEDELPE